MTCESKQQTCLDTALTGSDWESRPAVSVRLVAPQVRWGSNLEIVESMEAVWPTKPQA